MRFRPTLAVACTLVAGLSAACGSSGSSKAASTASGPGLHTETVAGVGSVLVDATGQTVYLFEPDARSKPTCTGQCAVVWPPVAAGLAAGGGAQSKLVGSVAGPNGNQLTYNGWPLYTFEKDTGAGQAHGQGVHGFGGYWYAVSAAGTAVQVASSPATTAAGGSSSGGY
ncbi:MAG: hypothetical protein KGQ66_02950 [Acidobacteriota bacterium]|nr:hypothetical protein [Acidobacteriota bacterium]